MYSNNTFSILRRRPHPLLPSYAWCRGKTVIHNCLPSHHMYAIKQQQHSNPLHILPPLPFFSSASTSVHGERPSAEYAKLRKESLEYEFGHVLGTHSSRSFSAVYRFGPFLALFRASVISFHVLKLSLWQFFVHDIHKRALKFRETLIHLGPFYIKLGQALSTRPDILPSIYCNELAKLQDQIPPFPTSFAIKSIETQLGAPVSEIFLDISSKPIAAASLGQVYKAHLHTGELVAVKVQRPGMSLSLTLDALLFHMIGGQLKRFAKARKDLLVAVNEMVRHMFEEIDYILEGENAERFASLYASYPCDNTATEGSSAGRSSLDGKQKTLIKVPKIYWKYTSKAVLTMEWIDGFKLTDEERLAKARLNRKKLVDEGLYCSLRQLLEVGFFHADPHPGNLVATDDGSLAYFDFGMMGDIPRHYRIGLIRVLVHFVNRDSLGLANDFLSLGFLPEAVDIQLVSDALRASFGDGSRQSRDFQSIMNQLYDVMYEFNFALPPDYALVIRALGSLEGTAKAIDPDFKVVESAYPFVIGRLLADPSPDMRKILRELLICNDGSIRWHRLERLVVAISDEEASDPSQDSSPLRWKTFEMRSVVAATEDLFLFILSEKGTRVRLHLVRDILKATDVFLRQKVTASKLVVYDGGLKETPITEGEPLITRVVKGFQLFGHAIKKSPETWMAMVARISVKPEFINFILEVVSALWEQSRRRIPESSWIFLSKLLHRTVHGSRYNDV